jgi:hypothetical protein
MRAGLLELEVEDTCHAGPAIQRKKEEEGRVAGPLRALLDGPASVAKWPLRVRVRGKGLRGGVDGRLGQAAVWWPVFFFFLYSFLLFNFLFLS